MTVAGVIATMIIAQFDYHWIVDKLWIILLGVSALLLAVTLIFGSSGENMETANRSWLKIPGVGIMIQPSEFVKIAMVCSFAKHISLVRERINHVKELALLALHLRLYVDLAACETRNQLRVLALLTDGKRELLGSNCHTAGALILKVNVKHLGRRKSLCNVLADIIAVLDDIDLLACELLEDRVDSHRVLTDTGAYCLNVLVAGVNCDLGS